jgi:3-oxoacyl-[acyl-carrier protein] reductase
MTTLAGRIAIVTGGARGMGAAVAARLAADGADVTVFDVSMPEPGTSAASSRVIDVGDPKAVEAGVDAVAADCGRLDILVNCAGVFHGAKLVDLDDAALHRVITINLLGTMYAARSCLRRMLAGGYGRIVNFASITPIRGEALATAYAASKGGIIGFTRSLAREVAHRGITVNAVAPGYIMTDMTRPVFEGALGAGIRDRIAMGRFGQPADIAGQVAFLASEEASYLTGQVIVIDGGVA